MRITGHGRSIVMGCLCITSLLVAGEVRAAAERDAADGKQRGNASYYSKHLNGRKTASGQKYDPSALTAAHRTLPLGTQVKVVNPKNDKSVVVTVNDRGPVPKNRVIDLSGAAANELGMKKSGVTRVETQVVGKTALPKSDEPTPPSRP